MNTQTIDPTQGTANKHDTNAGSTLQQHAQEPFDAARYAVADLHLHLDGSLSVDDVIHMAAIEGVELPADRDAIVQLMACPENCESLNDYLECFALPQNIIQCRETIVYSMKSLLRRIDSQGLVYAEIIFAPQQQILKGLTMEEATIAAIDGLKSGMAESPGGIRSQILLTCMRGKDNDHMNMETIELAKEYLGKGVCGIDLAGPESLIPTSHYRDTFAYAHRLGVPFTIHAGEADGVESIRHAVDYGARRIGHGIQCADDDDVKALLRERDICLTMCPTSNMQTKAFGKSASLRQYPLRKILDAGVPVCINTDNMTVSGTTLAGELRKLYDAGVMTATQAKTMARNAINHAFIGEDEKALLLRKARLDEPCE